MRLRIRKELPHDISRWRSNESSEWSEPTTYLPTTRILSRHTSYHVASPNAYSAFSLLSDDIPGTGNANCADDPVVMAAGLSAGAPRRLPFTDGSSAMASAVEGGSSPSGHSSAMDGGRKERRQWGTGIGPQASEQTMAAVRNFGVPHPSHGGLPTSTVDPALYQNLVDMIPLMESFLDQQGARTMFAHHASMVYTPTPPRDVLSKKTPETPAKTNKDSTPRRAAAKTVNAKEDSCVWEESENILRRVEGRMPCEEESPTSPQAPSVHAHQLQNEIEELKQMLVEKDCLLQTMSHPPLQHTRQLQEIDKLKQKLWEKDCLLETTVNQTSQDTYLLHELEELKQKLSEKECLLVNTAKRSAAEVAASKAARDKDVLQLQTQMEKLQQELLEKDQLAQSTQCRLSEKQHELGKMRSLLERVERDIARTNTKAASMEAELNGLRCQVVTLRYQLDAVDSSGTTDGTGLQQDVVDSESHLVYVAGDNEDRLLAAVLNEVKEEREKLELARRKYLGAIVAAREQQGEEALILVAELRMQLEAYLTQPSHASCGAHSFASRGHPSLD